MNVLGGKERMTSVPKLTQPWSICFINVGCLFFFLFLLINVFNMSSFDEKIV